MAKVPEEAWPKKPGADSENAIDAAIDNVSVDIEPKETEDEVSE